MNSLTTCNGDKGFTKTFKNEKISKSDFSIEALGFGDLLNCYIGRTRLVLNDEDIFPKRLNVKIQKTISLIMGHISYGDVLPTGNISSNIVEELDIAAQGLLEDSILEDYEMNDWLIYEGNDAQLASKFCRIFEQKFVKWCEERDLRDIMNVEIQFLNRLSDFMFYVGLHHQLTYEMINKNGTV